MTCVATKTSLLVTCLGLVAIGIACGTSDPGDDGNPSNDPKDDPSADFGDTKDAGSNGSDKARACDATSCKAAGGTCSASVCVVSENPGKVSTDVQGALKAGGKDDVSFAWLYPYDRTVFPRGLRPPTLQFAGAAPDAFYVRVSSNGLKYEGFFGGSNPARLTFSHEVWSAITLAAAAADDVKIEVTKSSGGKVTGPVTETWRIAQGSLAGTIYYETYDSALAGGAGSVGIMKIAPGAEQPTVLKKGCGNVCHTASADGSTLIAATQTNASASYDLKKDAATLVTVQNGSFIYGALTPDGRLSMSATHYRTWSSGVSIPIPGWNNGNASASRLYDTRTGQQVAAPGWDGVVTNGGTPAFSPEGKHLAFIDEDKANGHGLSVMDFDQPTRTFSNRRDVATDAKFTIGWPAFTPDSTRVVYHAGSNAQFETNNNAVGDLFGVEVASKKVRRLDALDGYTSDGGSYLPAKDPALNFAPTILPVAVGGYFWVVFTSHRSYGNMLASKDNNDQNGKLWVAALDIQGSGDGDPSHPAFYLDGQELSANNLRGFWVLNPCKSNGSSCNGGDDCCDGYCRATNGAPICVAPPEGCSNESEHCTTSSDCCNAGSQCINSHCAAVGPN